RGYQSLFCHGCRWVPAKRINGLWRIGYYTQRNYPNKNFFAKTMEIPNFNRYWQRQKNFYDKLILKKTTALFFITLFLFNLFGYRFVFTYMQQKASDQLEVKLDKSLYDESQLIELKVPMNLPYQTNWSAYQRYDGEIEVEGIMYKY